MPEIVKQFADGENIVTIYREIRDGEEVYYEVKTPLPKEPEVITQEPTGPTPLETLIEEVAGIKNDIILIKNSLETLSKYMTKTD